MRVFRFLSLVAILALALVAPNYAAALAKPIGKAIQVASRQAFRWSISSDKSVLVLTPKSILSNDRPRIYKAPKGERWFRGPKGLAAWYVTPGGSPMVADTSSIIPDTSGVVADVTAGTLYMTYDTNNNLDVNVNAGSITISGSLPAGTNQIGRLDDIKPQQSGAGLQAGGGCGAPPCSFTSSAGEVTLFYIAYYGTSMTGSQTLQCWDSATTSGTIVLFAANMGNTQIVTYGPNGRHLTSGKVTCQVAGTGLGANMVIEIGLLP